MSSTSTTTGLVAFNGIESGLNTASIISAYLAADEGPLNLLQSEQTANANKISAYQTIESQLGALETAAAAASLPNAFAGSVSASSSNSTAVTATTGPGATTGSTTFSVSQLATANTMVSSGTVSAPTDVVATGDLLVGAGGSGLGFASLSGQGLTTGSHTIAVTQSSAGATALGTTALAASTTIDGSNDQLSVSIDGTSQTYTVASGTYTPSQLAAAVSSASGGTLSASVSSGGVLQVATTEQGSAATLQIGAGSANAALGLAAGVSSSGTDAVVDVDGHANTVTDIPASGGPITLTSGTGGTVSATLSGGGLQAGTMTAQNVSVGNGSLASVVSAINGANAGVTAVALDVGTNQYALEVTSNVTGAANDVSIDAGAFASSGLGTLSTTTAGQDAIVDLGGPGGYQVSSSSNTLTGLLPGVSIALQSVTSAPVTVTVSPDGKNAATLVSSLVSAANQVLSSISAATAYNASTGTAGVLNGDYALQGLAQNILSVFSQAIGTSGSIDAANAGSAAGLSLDASTGQIAFNATTFAADYDADPTSVAAMFSQGGSFAPASGSPAGAGDLSLGYAGATTVAGSYDVVIDHSASQATDTGSAIYGSAQSPVGSSETYTVTSGGTSASYGIAGGESLADVASGMNAAFATAELSLSAQVVSNGSGQSLQITSAGYGSVESLAVSSSGSDQLGLVGSGFVGTDVAGTIDGIAATGDGQVLNAPVSDPTLAGLSLLVTTPGIVSSTDLGTYTYKPGVAGSLNSLATTSTTPTSGELPSTITGLQNINSSLASQITLEQQLVSQQQSALTAEFNNLETSLSTLKSESSYLSSLGGSSVSSSSGSVSSSNATAG
jgi:flagellar hook-associated protein 2